MITRPILTGTVVVLCILATRLLWWGGVFDGENVTFHGNDPYYLLRLAKYQASTTFGFIEQDLYSGYPEGQIQCFPPLFPAMASVPAWLIGLGRPRDVTLEVVAALVPVTLAFVSFMFSYLLARRLLGNAAALPAALLVVFSPPITGATQVGAFDTAAAEAVFLPAMVWGLVRLLPIGSAASTESDSQYTYGRILIAGSVCLLGILTWLGCMAFLSVTMVALGLSAAFLIWQERMTLRHALAPAWAAIVVGLALLPLAALLYPISWLSGDPYVLTWSYASVPLVLAFLYILSMMLLVRFHRYRLGMCSSLVICAITCAGVLAVLLMLADALGTPLVDRIGLFTKKDPWLQEIVEFRPLFAFYSPGQVLTRLGPGFYLQAIPFGWALWRLLKRESDAPILAMLLAAHLAFLAAAMNSVRWALEHAISLAFLWTWLLAKAHSGDAQDRALIGRSRILWCGSALIMLFWMPFYMSLPGMFLPVSPGLESASNWLKENTFAEGSPYTRNGQPDWAILSNWDLGHRLLYLSERAVVANPMITNPTGNLRSARFLLAQDVDTAEAILRRSNAKYVLTAYRDISNLDRRAATLGLPGEDYVNRQTLPDGRIMTSSGPLFWSVSATNLHLRDGAARDTAFGAYPFLRLVWESEPITHQSGAVMPEIKIFEHVAGAVFEGHAPPGVQIKLIARIRTNQGRLFDYEAVSESEAGGAYRLICPYSSDSTGHAPTHAERVAIVLAEREMSGDISQEDVELGRVFELPPFP